MQFHRLAAAISLMLAGTVHAECKLDQVKRYDQQLNSSIMAHDVAGAKALYADEFVLTTSRGMRKRAGDMLRDVGDPTIRWRANETHDAEVIGNGHTAVLYGGLHQSGEVNGQPFDADIYVTDTWTCAGDSWRLLAGQAVRATN